MPWLPFWMSGDWEVPYPGVKNAIVRKVVHDVTLQAIIGERFVLANPPTFINFPLVDFFLWMGTEDDEIARRDELYRLEPAAKEADVVDQISERIIALLHNQPLDVLGWRFAGSRFLIGREFFDEEAEVFRKSLDFRVITFDVDA